MSLLAPWATKRLPPQKADSIRSQGVLSPLLVRPLTENGFEIVFGARRYRAAQLAEQETLPVRIKHMTDAEVIEAQLVENLIRAEIHPMEEAEGFAALLRLDEPKYTIEQIAARVGKSPCVYRATVEADRSCARRGRSFICERHRRGPRALDCEAACRCTAAGAYRLLQGSLQRQQPETRADSPARAQPAILDRNQRAASAQGRAF
jgi:hypothetical protein